MTCPYCRSATAHNALVCAKCTRDLRTPEAVALLEEQRAKESNGLKILGIIALFVMGVMGACIFIVSLDSPDSNKVPANLESNLGSNACNATNGMFRGRILGVRKEPGGTTWVYVVDRNDTVGSAPVDNVNVVPATSKCPDGEPK